jgi:hypothetical protein
LEITSITASNVEPGGLAEMHGLGETLDDAGDGDLVHHLSELARPRRTEQAAGLGEALDDGSGLVEGGLIAADHDSQLAVLGAGLAARDWGVEEGEAGFGRGGTQGASDAGRGRRVVDEDGASLHSKERAVGADGDFAQIVVVADAGEYDVLASSGIARGGSCGAPILAGPFFGLCGGAIVDGDFVAPWP